MSVKIDESWKVPLESEFNSEYFKKLISFIKEEYSVFKCYPKGSEIFNAFDCCPIDKLKVVIIGQDPYHGINQANGLCFSVNKGISHPPSLINILKEIENDLNFKFEKNNATGIMSKGVFFNADFIISNSDIKKTYDYLIKSKTFEVKSPSSSAIIFYWGISKKFKQLDLHNIFFAEDYKSEFESEIKGLLEL